ncbi:MAG: hypothetical protein ACTH2M_00085 [Microbacteriaceae bacterium]
MSTATIAPVQPALFDVAPAYTAADRRADRQLCRSYLKQWAGSFKRQSMATEISVEDFNAAAARLAQ